MGSLIDIKKFLEYGPNGRKVDVKELAELKNSLSSAELQKLTDDAEIALKEEMKKDESR